MPYAPSTNAVCSASRRTRSRIAAAESTTFTPSTSTSWWAAGGGRSLAVEPSGVRVGAPEHRRGGLGERERRHPRAAPDRPVDRSEQHGHHRLGAAPRRLVDGVHRRTHGVMDRRGVDDEHAVDVVGCDRRGDRRAVVLRRGGPVEGDRRRGRPADRRRRAQLRRAWPGFASWTRPPRVGPRSSGCVASTRAVSSIAVTLGTSMSPECWYSAPPEGAMAAAPVRTATIGRRSETRRAMRAKRWVLPRVSLYMRDDVGRVVVVPELQEVVARHVGAVAERHEPRQAHVEALGEPQERGAERARLHHDGDAAGRQLHRHQRRLEADLAVRRGDAHARRADDAHAVASGAGDQVVDIDGRAFLAVDGGHDHGAANVGGDAVVERGVEGGGGHGDDRQPHVVGDRGDGRPDRVGPCRAITIDAADRRAVRVDRVHRHVGGAGDVAPQHGTDGVGTVRCPDDGDRAGEEQPRHRSAVGAVLALGERVEVLVGRRDREVDLDDPTLVRALQRPPGAGEDAEHRPVLGEHLGREALDAVRRGDGGEVLEQQGGDPLAVVGLVDHEGGVGVVASGPALVAGPGDELAVPLDAQRRPPDHVDVGEMAQLGRREHRLGGEEAPVVALG